MGFAEVRIVDRQDMLFAGTGDNLDRSILIDGNDLPEFVDHIMVMLAMLKGVNLPCSRAGRHGAFRFMVNYGITYPELRHLDLLTVISTECIFYS
jgi:hypothetical protein